MILVIIVQNVIKTSKFDLAPEYTLKNNIYIINLYFGNIPFFI